MAEKLKMATPEITDDNIRFIGQRFPNAVVETVEAGSSVLRIDMATLALELCNSDLAEKQERYQFTWPDKRKAILIANQSTTKTLRPQLDKSIGFYSTRNVYIEGDNLEALKILRETYLGKIKVIYIDPPYNTGSDFIYKDSFSQDAETYIQNSGQTDEDQNRVVVNLETNGRFHTDWLNMMFPRLKLAKDLLTEDGVIFISIDDNELHRLISICDEIFGEKNHISTLIWNKQHSQQQGIFKRYHESVLVYARNADMLSNIRGGEGEIEAGAQKKISKANPASTFTFPAGVRFDAPDGTCITGTYGDSEKSTIVSGRLHAMNGVTTEPVTISAGWTQKNQMIDFFAGRPVLDSKGQKVKSFFFNSKGKLKCIKERECITPPSLLPPYGMVSEQTEALAKLMGGYYFDNPKPVQMIKDFVSWFAQDGDIVLDFFSGSGTTAQSVMEYCAEASKKIRFLLVQLPELIKQNEPAYDAGYRNLCELGEDRIKRAGEYLQYSQPLLAQDTDIGFRIFRIDSSNMSDVYYNPRYATQSLLDQDINNVKEGRTELDLLFQTMLELGAELSASISSYEVSGKQVYEVENGYLIACFAPEISRAVIEEIARKKPIYIVFRDACFPNDASNINCEQLIKAISPSTTLKVL